MKKFNKLVRDNIPNIIENNNEVAVTKILDDLEFRTELYKKLQEECNEVIKSTNSSEILEELGDVIEVVRAIAKLEGTNINEIINIANLKREKRGGFEKRIFLEKTYNASAKK